MENLPNEIFLNILSFFEIIDTENKIYLPFEAITMSSLNKQYYMKIKKIHPLKTTCFQAPQLNNPNYNEYISCIYDLHYNSNVLIKIAKNNDVTSFLWLYNNSTMLKNDVVNGTILRIIVEHDSFELLDCIYSKYEDIYYHILSNKKISDQMIDKLIQYNNISTIINNIIVYDDIISFQKIQHLRFNLDLNSCSIIKNNSLKFFDLLIQKHPENISKYFNYACQYGKIDIVKKIGFIDNTMFRKYICSSKEFFNYLLENPFHISHNENDIKYIIENDDADMIEWLMNNSENVIIPMEKIFINGSYNILVWLHKNNHFVSITDEGLNILYRNKHIKIINWLCEKEIVPADNDFVRVALFANKPCDDYNLIYRAIKYHDNINFMKYIKHEEGREYFGLFWFAVINNHIFILDWLYEHHVNLKEYFGSFDAYDSCVLEWLYRKNIIDKNAKLENINNIKSYKSLDWLKLKMMINNNTTFSGPIIFDENIEKWKKKNFSLYYI